MRGNQKSKGRRLGSGGDFFYFFLHWNHDVNEAAITELKGGAVRCLQSPEEWHFYRKPLILAGNSMSNE